MIKVPVSIPNKFFRNPSGIKLLTRLKLCFSHLHERKFRQNFRDTFQKYILVIGMHVTKKMMIKVPVSIPNKFFRNPSGIKLLTRLKLCFSHLHEHKFRQNFRDTLNPICNCVENIETTNHYLFHCPDCLNERKSFLSNLQNLEENIYNRNYSQLSKILLFGDSSFNNAEKHRYFKCYCSIYICWYLKTWCLSNKFIV